ncbi:MAG: GIY-YIG nuclease family protein [Bacteroidales bacterium]|nr:GIY-YIG nuclease family protein [Bacteroidales bacterium]
MKTYYVYILSNKRNGILYIGFTNNLERRVREHKEKCGNGFAARYDVDKLVYYEEFSNSYEAFRRESRMKEWKRAWKIKLIEEMNPDWQNLAEDWE